MAIPNANFKSWLTTGNLTGSDGAAANNSPDDSLGGWRSSTEVSLTLGNLFELYTQPELTASTRYRCVAITNIDAAGVRAAMRLVSRELAALKTGLSVEFGWQCRDAISAAPLAQDAVAPTGVTFRTMTPSTDDNELDYTTANPIGPLNADGDNATEIDFDNTMVLFLYIKVIASGASGAFSDGVDNLIGVRSLGTDSI